MDRASAHEPASQTAPAAAKPEAADARGAVRTVGEPGAIPPLDARRLTMGGAVRARRPSPSELVYGATDAARGGDADAAAVGGGGDPSALVVEDDATPAPNQMKKSQLIAAVQAAAQGGGQKVSLPGGASAAELQAMPATVLESKLHQAVPAAAQAQSAAELVPELAARLAQGSAEPAGSSAGLTVDELRGQLGDGQPLAPSTRQQMERAFSGYGFGDVRVHSGGGAAQVASRLGARAFAFGRDVGFAAGQYAPGTPVGDALLAHELAHVVQQRGQVSRGVLAKTTAGESAALDADADHAATAAMQQLYGGSAAQATPALRSGLGIQRCPDSGGGAPSSATTAPAITIGQTTLAGPTFSPGGQFQWDVSFSTSGRSGWIVQEITNSLAGNVAGGAALSLASEGLAAHYYEAWAVDAAGAVTPAAGAINDMWRQPAFTGNSHGTWGVAANLFWTATDPASAGFSANNNATNAGILLSSTSAGGLALGSVKLTRNAHGQWDSRGGATTHTGAAG